MIQILTLIMVSFFLYSILINLQELLLKISQNYYTGLQIRSSIKILFIFRNILDLTKIYNAKASCLFISVVYEASGLLSQVLVFSKNLFKFNINY